MGGLDSILKSIFIENGRMDLLILSQIKKELTKILPQSIKKYIQIYKFTKGNLYIKSQHSLWSAELQFNKAMIINKLNEKLGGEIVKDIKIK